MGNLKLKIIKNAPTILTFAGIVLNTISLISAIKSTRKIEKKTTDLKHRIINETKAIEVAEEEQDKQMLMKACKDDKKLLTKLYIKAYAPCIITSMLATAAIVSSHNMFKARNIALAGTLTTLKTSLDKYRERVKDELGEDKEKALFNGLKIIKTKDKDGNEQKVYSKTEHTADIEKDNIYEVFYGPGNVGFDRAHNNLNLTSLLQQEQYFNQKLVTKGYVFLSEVLESLGFTADMLGEKKLQAAHVVGWIYDKDSKDADNYISFGLHDKFGNLTPEAKNFQYGIEEFILLEFNAQGDILTGDHGHPTFMSKAIAKGA